jgi:hypothetical protein
MENGGAYFSGSLSIAMCGWISVAVEQLTSDVALAGLATSEKTRAKTIV